MRHYGYIGQDDDFVLTQKDGQLMSGYPIGIMLLNVKYPIFPGNVANAGTFDFPVRYAKVLGVDSPRLHTQDPTIIEDLTKVGKELESDGVRAIICSCGYFGYWQEQLRERLNVPVYCSSLTQIPFIKTGLKKNQKIGVLCAVTRAFKPELLRCCGVDDPSCLVIKSMEDAKEFSAIPRDRNYMNNHIVKQEMIEAAKKMVKEDPEIGAILLECSDMPPYAAAIQNAVNLPVFDFTTLIRWVHSSVSRMPFYGFV
ncbi:MAG: aspartate/glutamate racemase family protein [Eubacteriaceae bacterium]|nr:aspartate/glutamate racemase family protein [Eubacteriaceae bacterium]MDD4508139.1 aspartate/glutamate racemase family protein [Eubacteriaceae bacterium]